MNKLLENVKYIGHLSATLAVLQGLRAKIELNNRQKNRLWSHFPALKGVILTGRAGAGKTWIIKSIFDKLLNEQHFGCYSVWVDGSATTVGRREKFKEHPYACIFWNEISIGDLSDVRLMKQLSEGVISYMKHGDLEEVKFTGLLIGTTNEFVGKGKAGKDLEALRDRMVIIDVGPPPGYHPLKAIDKEKSYFYTGKIDWGLINEALMRETDEVLTDDERNRIRPYWEFKTRECLDDRILTRAGNDFIDAFVFCKRFFGSLDDPEVFLTAVGLAYDSVTISPIPVAHLDLMQRDIIEAINSNPNKTLSTDDIKQFAIDKGRYNSKSTLHRKLSKLVENGYIIRTAHGEYSLLRPEETSLGHRTWETSFQQVLKSIGCDKDK